MTVLSTQNQHTASASLHLVKPLLPSGRCRGLAKSMPYLLSYALIGPVSSPLPSRAMHFGCCPAIWSEVCLWFFYPRYQASHAMCGYLDSGIPLHDRTSGAASAESDCRGFTFSAIRIIWLCTLSPLVFCSTLHRYLISAAWSLLCCFAPSVHDSAL
jgi:hypothetical protein